MVASAKVCLSTEGGRTRCDLRVLCTPNGIGATVEEGSDDVASSKRDAVRGEGRARRLPRPRDLIVSEEARALHAGPSVSERVVVGACAKDAGGERSGKARAAAQDERSVRRRWHSRASSSTQGGRAPRASEAVAVAKPTRMIDDEMTDAGEAALNAS